MTTKLEAMVGLLAGRKVDPSLLEELGDPSSEASLFLQATRNRSRALVRDLDHSGDPGRAVRNRVDRRWWIALVVVAAALITAVGLAVRAAEARLRRIENALIGGQAEARSTALKLDAALGRLAEAKPSTVSLGPVETAFGKLDQRLEGLERAARPTRPDPLISRVREEMVLLRRDLSAIEKSTARKSEELQASVHESARLLRLLINQTQPPSPLNDRTPEITPIRPNSGLENRRITP